MSPLTEPTKLTLKQQSVAPLLLDAYPGAAAAYSLRDLSWSYGGPVVRVRRSSDNTEQDFTAAQITDGTLTAFCGAGDGFVRTWYDQSGNNRNLVQVSAANQPKLVSGGSVELLNNKPAVKTSSTSGLSLSASLPLSDHSVFTVVSLPSNITASTNSFSLWRGDLPSVDIFAFGSTTGSLSNERISWLTVDSNLIRGVGQTTSDVLAGNFLYNANWTGSASSINANGNSVALTVSGNGNFSSTSYPRSFLRLSGSSDNTVGFPGSIAEFLLYQSDKSADRSSIEANINAHYAIF